jgi:hypothetical protein
LPKSDLPPVFAACLFATLVALVIALLMHAPGVVIGVLGSVIAALTWWMRPPGSGTPQDGS